MDHHPESQPTASAATMPVNAPQLSRPLSRADDTNRPSSATVDIIPRSSSPSQITPTPSNVVPPRPPPQQESILVRPTEAEAATQRSSTNTLPTNNASLGESAPRSKSPPHSALSAPAPSVPGAPPPVPAKPTPRQVTISDDRATMSTTHPGAPPSSSSQMPSLSDSSLLMPPPPPAAPTRPRRTSYADVTASSHTTTTTTTPVVPPRAHTPTTTTSPEVWFPVYSSSNSRPGTGVGAGANPPRRQNTSGSSYYTPHPSRANTGNNAMQSNPTFITHDETHEFGGVPATAGIPASAAVDDHRYSNVPGSAQPRADSERRNSSRPFSIRAPSQHENGNSGDGNGALDLSRSNTHSYEKVARSASEVRGPPTVSDRLKNLVKSATEERDRYAIKAKKTGYTLNVAIGVQVVLGALTTGFAAVNGSRAISLAVAGLGGTSTLVASYLARMRGSREPELSISIKKELDSFIRQVSDFDSDYGHLLGETYDKQIKGFRTRFEEIMGLEQAERKLSPPV